MKWIGDGPIEKPVLLNDDRALINPLLGNTIVLFCLIKCLLNTTTRTVLQSVSIAIPLAEVILEIQLRIPFVWKFYAMFSIASVGRKMGRWVLFFFLRESEREAYALESRNCFTGLQARFTNVTTCWRTCLCRKFQSRLSIPLASSARRAKNRVLYLDRSSTPLRPVESMQPLVLDIAWSRSSYPVNGALP